MSESVAAKQRMRAAVRGRRVLVTGAAGFIGSALVGMLAGWAPERLVLLDIAESGLQQLALNLDWSGTQVAHDEIVGDVCDGALLRDVFARYRPQVVLHAAACKHVSLMERNPLTAAKTNVLGTHRVLTMAAAHGAEAVVMVSTDKAADPASVMGATKRIAELLARGYAGATRMHAVRLGNVWGSTGSLVPVLERQIARGGPVTLTDAGCTRYFLPVAAAAERILAALALGESRAANFVCEAGEPRRIEEIAATLLRAAAAKGASIEVCWTGLQPGEKLTEAMVGRAERLSAGTVDGLHELVESPQPEPALLEAGVREIEAAVEARDLSRLVRAVRELAPEYTPSAALMKQMQCATVGGA